MKYPDLFVTWIMSCIDTAAFSVSINGELKGFFGSRRGIRQGCSMSPYLYVIISNVLSNLLNKAAANDLIWYHAQCQEVNLSHLSFADDIIVFTNGFPASLRHVLLVFEEFASLSGLQINIAKSTVLQQAEVISYWKLKQQQWGSQSLTCQSNISGCLLPPRLCRKWIMSHWSQRSWSRFSLGQVKLFPMPDGFSSSNQWLRAWLTFGVLLSACHKPVSMRLRACALHFYGVGRHMIHPKQKLLGRMYVTLMQKEAWVSYELEKWVRFSCWSLSGGCSLAPHLCGVTGLGTICFEERLIGMQRIHGWVLGPGGSCYG